MNLKLKALQVRKQFENKEIDDCLLKDLYSRYASVENIGLFIKTALNQFPKLNCGLASVYLQHLLGGKMIKGKYEDSNHTFLLVKDQVVDITADQYGGPKVYVGELKLPWKFF